MTAVYVYLSVGALVAAALIALVLTLPEADRATGLPGRTVRESWPALAVVSVLAWPLVIGWIVWHQVNR